MIRALAITGPTASGKTALSLKIAKELGCEIISCDSMQIYRGMDIGTAKATESERSLVRHHLIDFLSPSENYSVERYREEAIATAEDIAQRGFIPLFVGGTGLYIDSVVRPLANESPIGSEEIRNALTERGSTDEGRSELYEYLLKVDPVSAEKTHKNNLKRVVRALEIYEMTGKPKSYFDSLTVAASPEISLGMITLDFHERENLYKRVDLRAWQMIKDGLVAEAKMLYELPELSSTARQAIGYKELFSYFRGERTLDECIEDIKLASRRYAKRQLTWFRREENAVRIYVDGDDGTMKASERLEAEVLECAKQLLINKYK